MMFDTHGPVEGQESRSRLLTWARGAFRRSTDHRDREYYTGFIAMLMGTFVNAWCHWWRDPVNVAEYCYGGRDAVRMLTPQAPTGRIQHGG